MGLLCTASGQAAYTTASLTIPTVGSICMWLRPTSLGGTQRICGIADDFEGRFDGATLYSDWGQSGGTAMNFGTLANGTLYHICATWNTGTGAGLAFLNGTQIGTSSTRNGVTNGVMTLNARGTLNPFAGSLYDVRIYNRVLSAAEVATIVYSFGADSILAGLIHRWRMDEQGVGTVMSGATAKDDAGQVSMTSGTNAPTYVHDADLRGRRRSV